MGNTKEQILDTALRLFAERGYSDVSMRDIATAVGIQVSSIYHYFTEKREIFQSIIARAQEMTQGFRAMFVQALSGMEKVECAPFVRAGTLFVTGYLQNETISMLLRTLESERFHDAEAEAVWQQMLFTAPMEQEALTFRYWAERGALRETNIERLTAEYHAIVMLGYFTGNLRTMAQNLEAFFKRTYIEGGKDA